MLELDLKTVLVVTVSTAAFQAVLWLCVWRAWRHLYELKFICAGVASVALGVLAFLIRTEQPAMWSIVANNVLIKLGLVLLAEGMARFLGQPRYSWIGGSMVAFVAVAFCAVLIYYPDNVAIRIHISTIFTLVMMSVMSLALLRDRTQPPLLRWITIGLLFEYMVASIVQSLIEFRLPPELQGATLLSNRNAWYLMQATLFLIAFLACLLFMVSWRLSADLRGKNESLLQEIDTRRKLEEKLSASLTTERALREEQVDFMRVVSHEFRTPLAVIRNAADMIALADGKAPEATRERLTGIGEALNRMFSLIDRFMTDDQGQAYHPERLRLSDLLTDVRLHFEMTGRGERLHFTLDGQDAAFDGDPDMLETVLINLIDNALKYSLNDQMVHIVARREQAAAVLEVRDRGRGIPEQERDKIGRRFFRASNAKETLGTGLGLYSARRLLAYHDGTLQLKPNGQQGTLALMRLPLPNQAATTNPPTEEMMA
ncbi:MAG: HAMP domain-containing histidine kinase [Pseudomonadales bacterium]|jgi:signal transduction histidine kinase|nr:HAMP domain-containing histidine kinase [Pseudomonadales bacterium]